MERGQLIRPLTDTHTVAEYEWHNMLGSFFAWIAIWFQAL